MQRLCLEGTTERSDCNRGRSPRKKQLQQFCLEGSTPVAVNKLHVLWRSAFQAPRSRIDNPGTSYPVTIATLCSAFQALNAQSPFNAGYVTDETYDFYRKEAKR